jgi:hypothetical protein
MLEFEVRKNIMLRDWQDKVYIAPPAAQQDDGTRLYVGVRM